MLTATPEADRQTRASPADTVSAASAAAFRIGFGLLIALSAGRFLARGWVESLYLAPDHHLTYRWFGWVQPGPSWLLHIELVVLVLTGLCIAAGYRHRGATAIFLVVFAHTELIDAALYLNHYWFLTLTGSLVLALPVHHFWSLDAHAGRVEASDRVPVGAVWALRAHVGAVYFFAGLAKLNPDWLLRAEPLRLWFSDRADTPLLGPLLAVPAMAWIASWLAAALDLGAVVLLSRRKTRRFAYVALVVFHLVTGLLFQIGVFPLVMIVTATIFFSPDWPRELWSTLSPRRLRHADRRPATTAPPIRRSSCLILAVVVALQFFLPLRHYTVDSNVRWSEDGYLLAWRVMLTEKAGHLEFEITDPATGDVWMVQPSDVLSDWQESAAATRPDLIKATADLLNEEIGAGGTNPVEIRAYAWVSINGRPAAPLVNPTVDLIAHDRGHLPAGWILPAPWEVD